MAKRMGGIYSVKNEINVIPRAIVSGEDAPGATLSAFRRVFTVSKEGDGKTNVRNCRAVTRNFLRIIVMESRALTYT